MYRLKPIRETEMTEASLQAPVARASARSPGGEGYDLPHLKQAIDHAAHLLPAQGPITVFVHHNTLHAFEALPFHEAVKKATRIFNCQPYLSEDRYHEEIQRQRIRHVDLVAALREDLGTGADAPVLNIGTRFEIRLAMLQYPLRQAPPSELRWFIADTDALAHYRSDAPALIRERFLEKARHWIMRDIRGKPKALDGLMEQFNEASIERWSAATWEACSLQALWRICRNGVEDVALTHPLQPLPVRHRDLLIAVTGADTDWLVDEVLIRFCAAFLDQGFSHWALPNREKGFYETFLALYRQGGGPPDRWLKGLTAELARLEDNRIGPMESIRESLEALGVPEAEWDEFVTEVLLALRGWAGMIRQMEIRADRVAHPVPQGSLVGYLAVRLILGRFALAHLARETLGYEGPLYRVRDLLRSKVKRPESPSPDQRGFVLFQLAQVLSWFPDTLCKLTPRDWATLVREVESFTALDRRRVFHEAYERRYRNRTLDALSIRVARKPERVANPRFQIVCCIDEREESFLRHVEELAPDAETFSVAGFFGVAMYYRGAADAHFIPQCPIVIRPKHWVVEDVAYTSNDAHRHRQIARRALGTASHRLHIFSRTITGGLLVAAMGLLASIPLVARVLFPWLTSRVRRAAGQFVEPPSNTQLRLERSTREAGPEDNQIGFSTDEMTDIGERVLRDLGLTSNFARLVFFIGHGSNSLNNPHNSAYNCGACSGTAGAPNARAIAQILNDPRVRDLLADRGLTIPRETVFVGCYHNTCDDSLRYFDLDNLPRSHQKEFEEARDNLETACDHNAHERCRRFQSAPLDLSFANARRHVEGRSEDLSQTRPECGHATNALCIVGRRSRTRGLFLDRRAFINAYDPTQDDEDCTILTRTLSAAVPVCAGINLEYYFSYVDPAGWGCGTKLPHNVASLLGVMNGAASDLRTGLPWQMVEIHEPVRLLFIIETTPEKMTRIMDRNEGIGRLIRNGWVQLATLDPDSARIHLFRHGRFELYQPESTEVPKVAAWVDWYRGWRDHLGFALLEKECS
jgi:uncharacterized protein